jgi:fatty-acyl-CoA synthase
MRDRGIGSWIERRARVAPDRRALIFGSMARSYAELADRVRRLANGLRGIGVRPQDRVGWVGPNHPAFLETLFASAKLGAVISPVNHRMDHSVIRRVLQDSAPKVVLLEESIASLRLPSLVRSRVIVRTVGGGDADYEELLAESPNDAIDEPVSLADLCMLPYTSGTTGSPKGVMLTHGNVTWNVVNFLSSTDFRTDDVTVAIAPFFRVGGTGVNVLPVLFKGGTVVVPGAFVPDEVLRLIEKHRVTVGFGNPDLLDELARTPLWPSVDLSSIRLFITGGAPVPERLIRTYLERDIPLVQGYGLSEAAPFVFLLDQEDALRKVGSAGKPPIFVDVRIVRSDGTTCKPNETGELLVRGPNVMAGYWNLPDATREALDEEGWLRSGDAARVDEEGFFWIVDRVSDAYIASGKVVYPGDVERVLVQHRGVVEAGVAGIPIDREAEGRAFVVLADQKSANQTDLLSFCRERLDEHEVPASITFVDKLPRNSVGKLLRHELRRLSR